MNPKKLRDIQRAVHIIAGLIVGTYIYSPLADNDAAGLVVKLVVVPVLVLSGIAMWQMPRIRRALRARAGARPSA